MLHHMPYTTSSPNPFTLLAVTAYAATIVALVACGGSEAPPGTPTPATLVEQCVHDLSPALLACTPKNYDGTEASAHHVADCVTAHPTLAQDLRACRAQGSHEFAVLIDHTCGHECRVALGRL